jgi:hypothetical protein
VTIPRLHPRRFLGFSSDGVALFILFLAIAPLSLDSKQASASNLSQNAVQGHPYAVIVGTVWGPDDTPVYGVKVKIRRESDKRARWEVYSNHHGEFDVRVPAGKIDYVAWTDWKGYKSSVSIHVEYDERVDTGLHLK